METKSLTVSVKDASEGVVEAKFATLGVVDKDGDIIEPGAFGEQRVKVSAYNHGSWAGALPVGIGSTREVGDAAIADLKFFMATSHGRDHFETVKGVGDLQEWSFGFDVKEWDEPTEAQRKSGARRVLKNLHVFEVSPVLRGAGVGTETLSAKCDRCAAKESAQEDAKAQEEEALRRKIEEEVARAQVLLQESS